VYFVSTLIAQASSLVVFPLYTRVLGPADYGVLSLLLALVTVVVTVVVVGLTTAVSRFTATTDGDAHVVGGAVGFVAIGGVLIAVLGTLLRVPVSEALAPDAVGRFSASLPWALCYVAVDAVYVVLLAAVAAENRVRLYLSATIVSVSVSLALAVLLVGVIGLGVPGALGAMIAGVACAAPLVFVKVMRPGWWRVDRRLLFAMLAFGAVLLPMNLAGWVLDLSDRYFLSHWVDLTQLGHYSAAYRVGGLVTIACVLPFQTAFMPFVFRTAALPDGSVVLGKVIRRYLTAAMSVTFVVAVFGSELLGLLAGAAYRSAASVVPFSAVGALFLGSTVVFAAGIMHSGKPHYGSAIFVVASVLNIGLNVLLIPRFGIMGAAVATSAAYAFLAVFYASVSLHFYRIAIDFGPVLMTALWAALFGACALVLREALHGGMGLLSAKVAVVVAFSALTILCGGLNRDDRALLIDHTSAASRRLFRPGPGSSVGQ
jgi:O-antigen/teichoic acid export membrane protein